MSVDRAAQAQAMLQGFAPLCADKLRSEPGSSFVAYPLISTTDDKLVGLMVYTDQPDKAQAILDALGTGPGSRPNMTPGALARHKRRQKLLGNGKHRG